MVVYSIKDIEKLSGVKAHTIRIWEKRYEILEPKRTPTNIRYYLDDDLKTILNIALLNRHGIKISKIAKMTKAMIQRKVAEITDVDESFEGQLDSLTISLLELDEEKFVKLLSKNIEQRGFRDTMMDVIYPLLDKLALMWISGSIKTIHEKFVSYVIQRKCAVEIDKIKITRPETFLIYLPEGERNELSLLFLHYLIRSNGFRVINAGTDTGIYDLMEVAEIQQPEYVFTILNEPLQEAQYRLYISKLCEEFSDAKLLISGLQAGIHPNPKPDRVRVIKSSEDTIELLESLVAEVAELAS